jgi:hypothetical protein
MAGLPGWGHSCAGIAGLATRRGRDTTATLGGGQTGVTLALPTGAHPLMLLLGALHTARPRL